MKKIFFALVAFTATVMMSCSVDAESNVLVEQESANDANRIVITLANDGGLTRAGSALATDGEKSVSSIFILAFNENDSLLLTRNFLSSEIEKLSATLALPKSMTGKECIFYAVVNQDVSNIATYEDLQAILDSDAAQYNGTYDEVANSYTRAGGFVMTGSAVTTVGDVNTTTAVAISLKRTVAKVELSTFVNPLFYEKYPSAELNINSVTISSASSQTTIIAGSELCTGEMSYTHTQIPTIIKENIFYIYENGALELGQRVLLEISATFDGDGDFSTTEDAFDVVYPIEITGGGDGSIERNGYYHIIAGINGLMGQDCNVVIEVADWETPITQSVSLGV